MFHTLEIQTAVGSCHPGNVWHPFSFSTFLLSEHLPGWRWPKSSLKISPKLGEPVGNFPIHVASWCHRCLLVSFFFFFDFKRVISTPNYLTVGNMPEDLTHLHFHFFHFCPEWKRRREFVGPNLKILWSGCYRTYVNLCAITEWSKVLLKSCWIYSKLLQPSKRIFPPTPIFKHESKE